MFYITIKVSSFPTDSKIWCEPLYCWNHQCLNAFVIKWWLELINLTVTLSRKPVVSGVVVDLHNTPPPRTTTVPAKCQLARGIAQFRDTCAINLLVRCTTTTLSRTLVLPTEPTGLSSNCECKFHQDWSIHFEIYKEQMYISLQTENYVWKIWDKLLCKRANIVIPSDRELCKKDLVRIPL